MSTSATGGNPAGVGSRPEGRLNGDPVSGPEYLTSRQVGDLYQVSPRTVERWALEDPTMPATRVGRTLRFERAALEAWLRRATQGQHKAATTAGK